MNNPRDPIGILMKEHDEVLQHLNRLAHATEYIKVNGFSYEAFAQITEALLYINMEIPKHNEKEEKYLFPLMDRHGNGSPALMRDEHRELLRALSALKECIKDVEELRIHPSTIHDLIKCSMAVIELLRSHIAKENTILFPRAKQVLTSDEYKQLRHDIISSTVSVS
ncbi:MAG: hemerythrin domain-containing protein [Ignavibacteriae bacterium]|nr:hemerythrin domain-containing protein [Ignavibacteriota bacterium]